MGRVKETFGMITVYWSPMDPTIELDSNGLDATDAPVAADPDWVADAVFYQIFPDRFASSSRVPKPPGLEAWEAPPTRHGFKGGDLLGIVERLDYLSDLGITALYLNPVFSSASNHRYHTYDYDQVDPLLGGNDALRQLLDACHDRDMRVVLDGVFNHVGRGFWPFHHLLENGDQSPYTDWFFVEGWPLNAYAQRRKPNYRAWWGLRELPKLNVSNAETREYLLSVAERWSRFGIDGWRLDVPGEIEDPEFWPMFRRRVKAIRPDSYLVGEIWTEAPEWLQGDRFDALMNYPLARTLLGFVATRLRPGLRHGTHALRSIQAQPALDQVAALLQCYAPHVNYSQFNLLGSHDTERLATALDGDRDAVALAFLLQMTLPGTPCVYYGDELGLEGGSDPDCRGAFPWDRREAPPHSSLHRIVRALIQFRREHSALRRGSYRPLWADGKILAYCMSDVSEVLVVLANSSPRAVKPRLQLSAVLAKQFAEASLWSPTTDSKPVSLLDNEISFELGARSGCVVVFRRRGTAK